MSSYNVFSYIPIMKNEFILKTSIDKKTCEELIEATKDKLDEDIQDNLSNVRRTIWELHTDEDTSSVVSKIMDHVNFCIRTRLNYPHPNQNQPPFFDNKMFTAIGNNSKTKHDRSDNYVFNSSLIPSE